MATTRPSRRSASMAELSNNTETSLFTTVSNEHLLFAGTLRDWGDPLLQGREPVPIPLCPRCVTCKCESLKGLPNGTPNSIHHHRHHYHHHHPSCPNFHQHERATTTTRQRLVNKPKRRASSYDPSLTSNHHRSLIERNIEPSPSPPSTDLIKRKKLTSKIPIRISSATSSPITTTPSEHSPVSSINESQSLSMKSKIPRPISNHNSSLIHAVTNTNHILSTSDEDFEDR